LLKGARAIHSPTDSPKTLIDLSIRVLAGTATLHGVVHSSSVVN